MEKIRKQEESDQIRQLVSKEELERNQKVNKSSDKGNNKEEVGNSYVKKSTENIKDKNLTSYVKSSNKKLTSYASSSSINIQNKDNINKNNEYI